MKILPAFAALVLLPAGYATGSVDVALKPEGPWKPYETRTLDDLPAVANAQSDAGLTRYGGSLARQEKATGFFHATKRGARWWLVDPEGALYLDKSVVSVATVGTPGAAAALQALILRRTFRRNDGREPRTQYDSTTLMCPRPLRRKSETPLRLSCQP